jgi:hypothetical protein
LAPNVAAGELEGWNALATDPVGTMLLHPLAVAGGTVYDALARGTGWFPPMSDALRRELYGQGKIEAAMPKPGESFLADVSGGPINLLGDVLGVHPSDITATTPAEQYGRAVGSALPGAALMPGSPLVTLPALATGAAAGKALSDVAPEWLKPGAEMFGNVLTTGGLLGARAGIRNLLERDITAGPEPPPEAAPAAIAEGAPSAADNQWVSQTQRRIKDVVAQNAGEGGPQDLSAAATPPAQAEMTPRVAKAYRRMSELNQLVSPIEGEDNTAYVPGSVPTLAERMGDANISQAEKLLRERQPDQFTQRLAQNNEARIRAVDDMLMSDSQAADLKDRQQAEAGQVHDRLIAGAAPVDFQSLAGTMKELMANPRLREIPDVYDTLKKLNTKLYEADGKTLKTDPDAAWGIHDALQNMLTKAKDPMQASSAERFSVKQISDFKDGVDAALNVSTKGRFQTEFLDPQAEYLKSLAAYEKLMKFRNSQMVSPRTGMINANAFHKFVTDLAIDRGKPGVNPAMDVPDEMMQNLINIDQDLKRSARIDLGAPRGSQTNLMFALARQLGIGGVHAVTGALTAGTPFAGLANIGAQQALTGLGRMIEQRRLGRMVDEALKPPASMPPAQGNYPNALANPGTPP